VDQTPFVGTLSNTLTVKQCLDETLRVFNGVQGDTKSFELLDRLLSAQAYRLANWKKAAEEINYRRFLISTSL